MSTAIIELNQGQRVIVDASRYEWLMQWGWEAHWNKATRSYYARRRNRGGVSRVYMHRLLLGIADGSNEVVDHRNHETLDNRIENLRIATRAQNNCNRKSTKPDGLKGVRPHRRKWLAEIGSNGKSVYIGLYSTPQDAHAAYCQASAELHGDFSCHS